MKRFTQYLTEALDPVEVLGRNLAAKARYKQLHQSNPRTAHEFLQRYKARTEAHQKLYTLLKDLISQHLSRTSKLNITSGSNYAIAVKNVSDAVRDQFPELKHQQIARALNDLNADTETMTSMLIDVLFSDLKKL
jgi:hypothetical protein